LGAHQRLAEAKAFYEKLKKNNSNQSSTISLEKARLDYEKKFKYVVTLNLIEQHNPTPRPR
jgi:hypothetical protein